MILWKGHCSVHGRFSADGGRRAARHHPRREDPGAPGVPPRGGHQGRPRRLDGVHHQDHRGRACRLVVGDRHRAQPGQAAGRRAPRAADRLPRPDRLLLLDDEPDRPAAPGVGAGVARRGTAGQRDRGRPRDRALGQGRAPADARPARASHTATEACSGGRAGRQLEPELGATARPVVDTPISPPCAATMRRQVASPIPRPSTPDCSVASPRTSRPKIRLPLSCAGRRDRCRPTRDPAPVAGVGPPDLQMTGSPTAG